MTSKIKVNILADGGDNSIITSDGAGSFTASSSLASSVQSVGGIQNTPAFFAYRTTSDQSITQDTATKIQFQTELYDTNLAYDTSNYRFTVPAGQAGKYYLHSHAWLRGTDVSMMNYFMFFFYKNGNAFWCDHTNFTNSDIRSFGANISATVDLSVGDYIEVYARININSGNPQIGQAESGAPTTWFSGYKLIGA
jgi:predicted PurR-regulated permease PerM